MQRCDRLKVRFVFNLYYGDVLLAKCAKYAMLHIIAKKGYSGLIAKVDGFAIQLIYLRVNCGDVGRPAYLFGYTDTGVNV